MRQHTRSLRADVRRLAGTRPATDLARELGCTLGTLRTIASEEGLSLRFGIEPTDADRPGADDRAVARLDAGRTRTIELNGLILSAEVAARLTAEAASRGTSLKALAARLVSVIAIDSLTAAVLDDR